MQTWWNILHQSKYDNLIFYYFTAYNTSIIVMVAILRHLKVKDSGKSKLFEF